MNVAFSVILPTYNRKLCIGRAIDSLLSQSFNRFELIVIDDGSSDGTKDFLEDKYNKELNDRKIRYIKLEENKGVSFARNEGLKRSQYEWVAYLDSDNQMRPDFLGTFSNYIIRYPEKKAFYAQARKVNSGEIVGHEFDFNRLIHGNYIDLGVFVHARKLYETFGGFDIGLRRLVDWDLIIRYSEEYSLKFIEEVLLDYYDGSDFSRITNCASLGENYKKIVLEHYQRVPSEFFMEQYNTYYKMYMELEERMAILEKNLQQKNQQIKLIEASKFWKLREFLLKNMRRKI